MASSKAASSTEMEVNASPTKSFFISVLIKDIDFIDALIELIDNSVDAVRARLGDDLRKGHIQVNYSTSEVSVIDDGVGISIDQAHKSTFRFGRPTIAKVVPGSVGAFGVGMKRALFKIGRWFEVESSTSTERFRLPVNVADWEKDDDEAASQWKFEMATSETNLRNNKTGTSVVIKKLHEYSKEELRSATFGTRLREKLTLAHETALGLGLKLSINGLNLQAEAPEILVGKHLKPIHIEDSIRVDKSDVSIRIYAGVGDDKLRDAGWYVFCNGRQIESAEKTKRTGWDTALDTGDKTPRPHWQFRRFRGYVFFDSPASSLLPWNTMKTGLNVESAVYRKASQQMIMALRDVITFLNALDAEDDVDGPLHAAIDEAKYVRLSAVPTNAAFRAPRPRTDESKLARISFKRDPDLVDLVKEELGVATNREVGEQVFDFFVRSKKLL